MPPSLTSDRWLALLYAATSYFTLHVKSSNPQLEMLPPTAAQACLAGRLGGNGHIHKLQHLGAAALADLDGLHAAQWTMG